MAATDSQDHNLPASQRKLQRARAEGQVPRSRDLAHFAALAAGGAALVAAAPGMASWLQQVIAGAMRLPAGAARENAVMTERLVDFAPVLLWVALPAGALMSAVAVAASLALGGWNWSWKALRPDLSKLDPIAGLPRLFARAQLIDVFKATVLAALLGSVGALYLRGQVDAFLALLALPLPVGVLALFALVDAPLQRFLHAARLKMSKQEARQEYKEAEGNVEVKARIKTRMREMSNRRMLAAVPKADLVVMNPTHYAVALKYEEAPMRAPRVVAKGADLMPLRIRDGACVAEVPVLQAPVLARALYAHAELDHEVPVALFAAVAQVLAYVYQLRAAAAGQGTAPPVLPELKIPAELDPHRVRDET